MECTSVLDNIEPNKIIKVRLRRYKFYDDKIKVSWCKKLTSLGYLLFISLCFGVMVLGILNLVNVMSFANTTLSWLMIIFGGTVGAYFFTVPYLSRMTGIIVMDKSGIRLTSFLGNKELNWLDIKRTDFVLDKRTSVPIANLYKEENKKKPDMVIGCTIPEATDFIDSLYPVKQGLANVQLGEPKKSWGWLVGMIGATIIATVVLILTLINIIPLPANYLTEDNTMERTATVAIVHRNNNTFTITTQEFSGQFTITSIVYERLNSVGRQMISDMIIDDTIIIRTRNAFDRRVVSIKINGDYVFSLEGYNQTFPPPNPSSTIPVVVIFYIFAVICLLAYFGQRKLLKDRLIAIEYLSTIKQSEPTSQNPEFDIN